MSVSNEPRLRASRVMGVCGERWAIQSGLPSRWIWQSNLPPLCILEHCWSLQIIRKTRGAYPSTAPYSSSSLCGLLLHFVASAGTPLGPAPVSACVRVCLRGRGEKCSGCLLIAFVFFMKVWGVCDVLPRMLWDGKKFGTALFMECWVNEVLNMDHYCVALLTELNELQHIIKC